VYDLNGNPVANQNSPVTTVLVRGVEENVIGVRRALAGRDRKGVRLECALTPVDQIGAISDRIQYLDIFHRLI
jgi:hypothetical protein